MPHYDLSNIEDITIGAGVVYYKYAAGIETMLAPTRGGNSFVVDQEVKIVERDGARGKEKGLRWITRKDATLTVNLMNLEQDNIKLALCGDDQDSGTDAITAVAGRIPVADYLEYVKLVGETLNGDLKEIILYNGLADGGFELSMTDRDEGVVSIEFSAHWDPEDDTKDLYKIQQASAPSTYNVTFTIEDNSTTANAIEDAIVYFDSKAKLSNASGVAIFYGLANSTGHAYTVAKGNFGKSGTVAVSSANATETVYLEA